MLTNAHMLRDAATITVWVGTGVAEQLLLAWLVQLLKMLDVERSRLRLIQFIQHPADPQFEIHSVGMLGLSPLAAHPPAVSLDDHALARLESAWAAITAPTPERLVTVARAAPLQIVERSLASLLGRFPGKTSGLSQWDMTLLRCTAERAPNAMRIIGNTIGYDRETPDRVDDRYLVARLRSLADTRQPRPLVTLAATGDLRDWRVDLTDAGRAVLAGRLNALDVNGIDDWVGGTHLESGRGNVWVHDDGRLERRGGPAQP